MKKEAREFIKKIKLLNYPKSYKSELATRILYYASIDSSKKSNLKFSPGAFNEIVKSNQEIKDAYDCIAYSYLSKKDFKELSNFCINKFRTGSYINVELYKLVNKLLDLEKSDLLLHVNAPDEAFLLEASNNNKAEPLKLSTLAIPDNEQSSELIKMRLELNETNYTNVDDISKLVKFKPNKIFINPIYSTIDKGYKYSIKANSFWDDLIQITSLMPKESRVVALVPNVMLSNSVDKDKKEILIKNGYLEGLISLPLRYYSNSLKVEVSLLVISKGNSNVKVVDMNKLFTISDVKSAKLDSITDYIADCYVDNYVVVEFDSLISKKSNLQVSNIVTDETYIGMKSLKNLSLIADVSKGSKKTKVGFKDILDQSGESPYCLLSSSDIEDGSINYERLTKIIYHPKVEKYLVKKGDVVITNKSSKPKIAVVECDDLKIIPTGSMIILSPHKDELDGIYLKMFFESNRGIELLSKVQRGQKTSTLYPEDIEMIQVPCIEYKEQLMRAEEYKIKLKELAAKKTELETIKKEIKRLIN